MPATRQRVVITGAEGWLAPSCVWAGRHLSKVIHLKTMKQTIAALLLSIALLQAGCLTPSRVQPSCRKRRATVSRHCLIQPTIADRSAPLIISISSQQVRRRCGGRFGCGCRRGRTRSATVLNTRRSEVGGECWSVSIGGHRDSGRARRQCSQRSRRGGVGLCANPRHPWSSHGRNDRSFGAIHDSSGGRKKSSARLGAWNGYSQMSWDRI